MPKCYGYTRVSTGKQAAKGMSLDSQQANIRKIAARMFPDHEYVEGYVDSQSAYKIPFMNRQAGFRLCNVLERGDAVVVAVSDRIFCGPKDCWATMEFFHARGIRLYLDDLQIDFASPIGEAMLSVRTTFARLERRIIGNRQRESIYYRHRFKSKFPHPARYGWLRDGQDHLVPDLAHRQNMRHLENQRLLCGYSMAQLARYANREGIANPSRRKGSPWNLYNMWRAIAAMRKNWPAPEGWVMGKEGFLMLKPEEIDV